MILVYIVLSCAALQSSMVLATNLRIDYTKFCRSLSNKTADDVSQEANKMEREIKQKLGLSNIDLNKHCQKEQNQPKVECQFLKAKQLGINHMNLMTTLGLANVSIIDHFRLTLLHPALRNGCGFFYQYMTWGVDLYPDVRPTILKGLHNHMEKNKLLFENKNHHNMLADEIEELCEKTIENVDNETFCRDLPEMKRLVDTYELVKYEPKNGPKWNAYQLHFGMIVYLHPKMYKSYILGNQNIDSIVKKNYDQIFEYVRNHNTAALRVLMEILPLRSPRLKCEPSPKSPERDNRMCLLWKAITLIRNSLAPTAIARNGQIAKHLNTKLNYPRYLRDLEDMKSLTIVVEQIQKQQLKQTKALKKLGTWIVNEVGKNVNERFKGLRSYFQKVAYFSKKKSQADIGYIEVRLKCYKDKTNNLTKKLATKLDKLLNYAFAITKGEIAEDSAQLSLVILGSFNPLGTLFGLNFDSASDIADRAAKLATTVSKYNKLKKLWKLFKKIEGCGNHLKTQFQKNKVFLQNVKELIDSFTVKMSSSVFDKKMNVFLSKYEKYDPHVKRPQITAMASVYTGLVEECCNIIDSTQSSSSAAIKKAKNNELLCIDTKVEITEMFETFSEIYNFQFDLIESMASFVKAATEENSAIGIAGIYEEIIHQPNLKADTFLVTMTSFAYMAHNIHILSVAHEYCDILTYKEGGKPPKSCHDQSMDILRLKSYVSTPCRDAEHYCDVPVVNKNNDTGFMNLTNLYAGKKVNFQIPDAEWLVRHKWISKSEKNSIVFVKQFQVYLISTTKLDTIIHTEAKVSGENKLTPKSNISYTIVPPKELIFEYTQLHNNNTCKQTAKQNPYGPFLPKLCIRNVDDRPQEMSLFPSVYSKWKISITGYESVPVPKPANDDFTLKVGVKLCVLKPPLYDQPIGPTLDQDNGWNSPRPSCPKHQYWSSSRNKCADCPKRSKPAMDGYYCEKSLGYD